MTTQESILSIERWNWSWIIFLTPFEIFLSNTPIPSPSLLSLPPHHIAFLTEVSISPLLHSNYTKYTNTSQLHKSIKCEWNESFLSNLTFQISDLTSTNSNHLYSSKWLNTHIFSQNPSQIKISPPFSRTHFKTLKNTPWKKFHFSKIQSEKFSPQSYTTLHQTTPYPYKLNLHFDSLRSSKFTL